MHTPFTGPGSAQEHACQGQRQATHNSHSSPHDKPAAFVCWREELFGCNKASINHSVSAGLKPNDGVGFQRTILLLWTDEMCFFLSLPPSTPTLIPMRSGNQPQTHRKFVFFVLLSISVHNEDERFVNTLVRVNVCRCSRDLLQSARHGERRENVPQSQQITRKLNQYFNIILFFDAQRKELQNNNPDIQSNPVLLRANVIYIFISAA